MRWAVAGAVLGLIAALVVFAPARWLADGLARATASRVILAEARGTVWRGSAILVLTGGADSRDASVLPGRIHWRLRPQFSGGAGLRLDAEQACCINGQLSVIARAWFGSLVVELPGRPDWIARWPSAWLSGLGTPWNTLQPGGQLQLRSQGLRIESVQGRWRLGGSAELDVLDLSSRLSTLPLLGSYRLGVQGDPAGGSTAQLRLSTQSGALQLDGQGQWSPAGLRMQGEARAATPSDEQVLGNLLNLIGRRQGARSVFSIG